MSRQEDRELLELAAKAAGYKVIGSVASYHDYYWDGPDWGVEIEDRSGVWNPLEDCGDAFELIAKFHIEVEHNHPSDSILWVAARLIGLPHLYAVEHFDTEDQRSTAIRRAIVRAVALVALHMGESAALEIRLPLNTFEDDWNASGMEAYDDL